MYIIKNSSECPVCGQRITGHKSLKKGMKSTIWRCRDVSDTYAFHYRKTGLIIITGSYPIAKKLYKACENVEKRKEYNSELILYADELRIKELRGMIKWNEGKEIAS